jgi:FkbM family methyltransferase
MKPIKFLLAYIETIFGPSMKKMKTDLLGKSITIFKNTISPYVDKDDAWFLALSHRHERIYDIGANMGYTAMLASLHNENKTVVLVDPNPKALICAADNLVTNNLSVNKIFVPAFISDKSAEKVKFYTLGVGSAGSMFPSAAESAKMVNSYYWVNTLTIDDLVNLTGITPDFLKVDVEGAESFVLNGALQLASKQIAKFIVEMHSSPEMSIVKNAELIMEWCSSNNYTPYYLKEHRVMDSPQVIANRGRCHLLLIPKGQEYPAYLTSIPEGSPLSYSL